MVVVRISVLITPALAGKLRERSWGSALASTPGKLLGAYSGKLLGEVSWEASGVNCWGEALGVIVPL